MPPSTTLSPTPSFHSMDEIIRSTTSICDQDKTNVLPPSARECLVDLIQQVEHDNLRQVLKIELNRLLTDHERIVTMLQQRTHMLEQENEQLRGLNIEHQRRYEKAVREMQFFKKKADYLSKQQQSPSIAHSTSNTSNSTTSRTRSHSSASETRSEISAISSSAPLPPPHAAPPLPPPPPPQQQALPPTPASTSTSAINYPLTPTSPQPSVVSEREEYDSLRPLPTSSSSMPSRSSSTSSSNVHHYQQSFWNAPPLPSMSSVMSSSTATSSLADNVRPPPNYPVRHAGTNSIYSVGSDVSYPTPQSSSEATPHPSLPQQANGQQKRSWQNLRQNPSVHSSYSTPCTISSGSHHGNSTATITPANAGNGSVPSSATSVYSVPMTPVRSTTSTNGYTGSCMIQQRRVDPLMFGASDGLWDTISKSSGSDVTVEKIISNFLRRGGSPNTAKQSPTCHDVKYGYGMVHALIVTKAPGALDLLLQQGANPNALTLSEADENKVTPCYLAARVGWLAGLQKVVQAGGDLISARGEGPKKKTALHTAAEHCHAAVVEFIVGYTQGALNHEVDAQGATALHYACLSGHTDLVGFLVRSCRIPPTQGTNHGEQPIHWAARAGRLEVVALLIERFNCDFNAYVSKRVPSPLDIAKTGGHKRLVDYLKGLGALSSKKLDKKHKNDKSKKATVENALARNGLFADDDDDLI